LGLRSKRYLQEDRRRQLSCKVAKGSSIPQMAERSHMQPGSTGVGLRAGHVRQVLTCRQEVDWLEIHPENYMSEPRSLVQLELLRRDYPISFHGVGLSLGTESLDHAHLSRLAQLTERLEPFLVSEHLSWGTVDGAHFNELLPLPYTEEVLDVLVRNVRQAQDVLARQILIENPAHYLQFRHSTLTEATFLTELVARTGCGLLCDINNLFVSEHNVGIGALAYLSSIPAEHVGEIHLAGHAEMAIDGDAVLIDNHGGPVSEGVWQLYGEAIRQFGDRPTLVEWDTNLPPLCTLIGEAARARELARSSREVSNACAA
jgi:uncharacterized protein